MRVISGIAKGHRLVAPNGMNTRPTSDKIKESLFNIIAAAIYNCRFLDLFSGSGAIGIEALSRGASYAAFVEYSAEARAIVKKNLTATKLLSNAEIYGLPVEKALPMLKKQSATFDIIFLDPPYATTAIPSLLSIIYSCGLLSADGIVIVEHSQRNTIVVPTETAFVLTDTRKYGAESTISFFKLLESTEWEG